MSLKVGDTIPHFQAKDANGDVFDSHSIIGIHPVVIYFYPKDETPGCTLQACAFRDQYQDFKDMGAEVIGISSDSETSHKRFIAKYQLPFILLTDGDKKLKKLFGVPNALFGLIPGRVTYVADVQGRIVMIFDSVNAVKHIPKAKEALKKLL
ncbi:MAG: peroxiredoxin [Flavobacterium sp.]